MPGDPSRRQARQAALTLLGALVAAACSTLGAGQSGALWPRVAPGERGGVRISADVSPSPSATLPTAAPLPVPSASSSPLPSPQAVPSAPPVEPRPNVRVIRLKPRPRPGPFAMDLYRPGDFVHQQTKDWCVAGSTQTMMNIIDRGRPNRSAAFQEDLYLKGRRLSPNKRKLGPIGVDLIGWAELLDRGGYGPYVVDGAVTRRGAIHKAARALRLTGRPVGLVTWRGAHSWVMSGFTATADPAYTRRYRVTAVHIQDVWYPYVSTIWGASRPPDSLVPVAALAADYLPYQRPRARYPARDGKFMLVLPRLPRHTVVR